MSDFPWGDTTPMGLARNAALAGQTFEDRTHAGRALADELQALNLRGPLVVLALPRGGVPVAAEIARALCAPLDLLLVRKIGAPFQPELAVAAVVEGSPPDVVINEDTAGLPGVDEAWIQAQVPAAVREIERRRSVYLAGHAPLPVEGATVIVVDDGIATGTTLKAALRALRRRHPARLIVAVPVGPHATMAELSDEVDEVVCLLEPRPFRAIGLHYLDFHQLADSEVCAAFDAARARHPSC
ncbi:MAG: phosphoribosyltransferase [Hydrogenophaga sp.]|uniref:phosphoribosyltransferase n=1 Tax=Hydrogenophaga sp. TaxID=1904254 RepID=UPI002AB8685C|nr:phosphoribosyltransferase [Hydrogenophaga sp.]MDZ4279910.1 phosphoribosyltransferase [Hydrogenophaga sp.]